MLCMRSKKTAYKAVKRVLDVFFSLLGIIACLPFIPVFAALIKTDSPGPMLFRQRRAGKNAGLFTLYKLRTMRADAPGDVPTHLLRDSGSHITKLGAFLRRSSIDELPQLWNILRGDMSIVGPRPALWNQEDLIALREANGANAVRPGLTGLAQVTGRDELPISVKAACDGEYVQKMSFWLDLKIVLQTAANVAFAKGVKEGRQ